MEKNGPEKKKTKTKQKKSIGNEITEIMEMIPYSQSHDPMIIVKGEFRLPIFNFTQSYLDKKCYRKGKSYPSLANFTR